MNYSNLDERKYWFTDHKLVALDNTPGYKLYFCESEEDNYDDSWFVIAKTERSAKKMWRDYNDIQDIKFNDITAFPVLVIPEETMQIYIKDSKKHPDNYCRRGTAFLGWLGIIKEVGVTILSEKQPHSFIYNGIFFEEGDLDIRNQEAQEWLYNKFRKGEF